jgi:hypothetical protein
MYEGLSQQLDRGIQFPDLKVKFDRTVQNLRALFTGTLQPDKVALLTKKTLARDKEHVETAPVDTALEAVLTELDTLTDFAVSTLNPFTSLAELNQFSQSINRGAHHTILVHVLPGYGEKIQMKYLLQFFTRFFPKIEIQFSQDNKPLPLHRKIIKVDMLDYFEYQSKKSPSDTFSFSMIQTKIIHTHPCTEHTRQQLKKILLEQIDAGYKRQGIPAPSRDIPIVVGYPTEAALRQLQPPFRVFRVTQEGISSTIHLPNQMPTLETQLQPHMQFYLRALYAIADYAVVNPDKNKIEAVQAGAHVLQDETMHMDDRHNSNHFIDHFLGQTNHLKGIMKHYKIPLHSATQRTPLTQNEIATVYDAYLEYKETKRPNFEPDLKETMRSLLLQMKA